MTEELLSHVSRKDAVGRLEELLATGQWKEGDRLPSEREFAEQLGVSRGTLRQALAALENAGKVWRRVGRGTFVGQVVPGSIDALAAQLANLSNPVEVTEVRLLIEPRLAALAAIRGNQVAFAELRSILAKGLASCDQEESHFHNEQLHLAIAKAARNRLLLGLFETVFRVRSLTSWGKLQAPIAGSDQQATIWEQHVPIVEAIVARDPREAEHLMRQHIEEVQLAITMAQDAWVSRTSADPDQG
jgi:GntR family transcriptional repressor for pyruvate dehydrogenase complex